MSDRLTDENRKESKVADAMKNKRLFFGKGDTWKRGIAFFLACVMLFSVMPVQAFAEEGVVNSTEESKLAEESKPTEEPKPTEETKPAEPKNVTGCMDQLKLSLKDWWYANRENTVAVTEEKKADFSGFTQTPDAAEWAGVSLRYEAVSVLAGDWFTVVLPEQMADLRRADGFVTPLRGRTRYPGSSCRRAAIRNRRRKCMRFPL